jgi:1-acyl-sn-glycerol-3-phosphate acyltransferase
VAGRALASVLFYRTVRHLFRAVAAPMYRFTVEGAEKVPATGAAVLVAAHRSWLDPACVGGACPRVVRFLIVDTVYHKPWARWFYRMMGAIPLTPGGSGSIGALREALRTLKRGELIGIFPEGRVIREGESGLFHSGAALLAARAGAPIIPLGIHGTAAAWPHGRPLPGPGRVSVSIGNALEPPAKASAESVADLTGRIEKAIAELQENGWGAAKR